MAERKDERPIRPSSTWAMIGPTLASFLFAVVSIPAREELQRLPIVLQLEHFMLGLLPGIERVSAALSDPDFARLTLSVQWCFLPIYAIAAISSVRIRALFSVDRIRIKVGKLSGGVKFGALICLGLIFLCLLGDVGAIDFPGFLNSGLLVPPETSIPILRFAYKGHFGFAIYGWIAPILEAYIVLAAPMLVFVFFALATSGGNGGNQ
jgi:hypothetical protein